MPEGEDQVVATIFDSTPVQRGQVQARLDEGIGLALPWPRDLAHEDPQWYEMDLDDALEDPDEPHFDPMTSERHFRIPD